MLRKRMVTIFLSMAVTATTVFTAVPAVSAATKVTPDNEKWGFTPAYYYDTTEVKIPNWGSSTSNYSIRVIPDSNGGYAMWVKKLSSEYATISPANAPTLTAGTYTICGDIKIGGSYGHPKSNLSVTYDWSNMEASGKYSSVDNAEWGTFSHTVTIAEDKTWKPEFKVEDSASVMIDNLAIKDENGMIIYMDEFNTVSGLIPAKTVPSKEGWGYTPAYCWNTKDAPFVGWEGSDSNKTVSVIPDGNGGYAMWIKSSGKCTIRHSSLKGLPADTYTISGDVKLGGSNGWPSMRIADNISWAQWEAKGKYNTDTNSEWGTFEKTVTASSTWNPFFEIQPSASTMIDNFKITNSSGDVVFEDDFDTVSVFTVPQIPSTTSWGYTPAYYWDTTYTAFANWTTSVDRHNVRVIEGKDGGFAMWIKSNTGDGYSTVNAKGCPALQPGTYTLTADAKLGGASKYPSTLLQETKGWTAADVENQAIASSADKNAWSKATWTITVAEGGTYVPAFKPNDDCSVMLDNFTVTDSEGNVVWSDDFENVKALSWVKQEISGIDLEVEGEEVTVTAEGINTTMNNLPFTLITCVYDENGVLEEIRSTVSGVIPSRPTPVNATNKTTVSVTENVAGDAGKTFKAFIWDNMGGLKPLAEAESVVIK